MTADAAQKQVRCGLPGVLRVVLLTLMLWTMGASALATSGTLYFKFLDSSTGGGIEPDVIQVDGKSTDFQVEAGSLVALPLEDGTHAIAVEAADYEAMEFTAAVSGDATPVMTIELDRAAPAEPEPVASDAAILEGHVTDADTGALLDQVMVTLSDAQMSTVTDESGAYSFDVVVGATSADARPAVTMEVKAEDYRPLRLKNLSVAAGERRRVPVRLNRTTTETLQQEFVVIDDSAVEGHLRTADWTFDVTVR